MQVQLSSETDDFVLMVMLLLTVVVMVVVLWPSCSLVLTTATVLLLGDRREKYRKRKLMEKRKKSISSILVPVWAFFSFEVVSEHFPFLVNPHTYLWVKNYLSSCIRIEWPSEETTYTCWASTQSQIPENLPWFINCKQVAPFFATRHCYSYYYLRVKLRENCGYKKMVKRGVKNGNRRMLDSVKSSANAE